jgi:mannosyl-3-phosphoglycerate phosphatase
MTALLIATDLDGSLLDHHSYSFAPAEPALAEIRRRRIPLVLCSSKTRAEMLVVQAELAIDDPFICENGAAICSHEAGGLKLEALAPPRERVLEILSELRESEGFAFTGFADLSAGDIAEATGLPLAAAERAAAREFSEPLRWEDSEQQLARFLDLLAQRGLQAQQGGRFLSVAGPADKGLAVTRLRQRLAPEAALVALGDSPNDESMLAAADVAVIIKSERSAGLAPGGCGRVIRTRQPGPAGWQEAMSALLQEFQ